MRSASIRPRLNKKFTQALGFNLVRLVALLTVLPILGIVAYIIIQGTGSLSLEFLTQVPTNGMRSGGIFPAIVGTFYLTIGTALFAVPRPG